MLFKNLKKQAREIKDLKMTPAQDIHLSEERLQALTAKAEAQKAKATALGVREKFMERRSIDLISQRDKRTSPDIQRTRTLFQKVCAAEVHNQESPIFNDWLGKLQQYKHMANFEGQTDDKEIRQKVEIAIRKAFPWKAQGLDGIPAAAYEIFPTAKEHVIKYITSIIKGEKAMSEIEVRARVTLLFKEGDTSDPINYRLIAVLNTEYKLLTAVLADIIQESIPEWMIQLVRKGVRGACTLCKVSYGINRARKRHASQREKTTRHGMTFAKRMIP